MRDETDSKMKKLNPLELFAEKLSPEADRAMTRVVERSTRRQLDAIKRFEDKNRLNSLPGKDLVASFGEIVAGEKHVGLADYRPLGKMRVSSGQRFSRRQLNPRSGNGAISPAKTLRFGNNNVIVQILDSESGQQFVLAVSDHRRGISHAFARHKAKKEA